MHGEGKFFPTMIEGGHSHESRAENITWNHDSLCDNHLIDKKRAFTGTASKITSTNCGTGMYTICPTVHCSMRAWKITLIDVFDEFARDLLDNAHGSTFLWNELDPQTYPLEVVERVRQRYAPHCHRKRSTTTTVTTATSMTRR